MTEDALALIVLREALFTIGTECENYTGRSTCVEANRIRGGMEGYNSWCHGCIARVALEESVTRRD